MTTVGTTASKLMAWMTDMLKLRAWTSVESQYIVIRPSHAAQRGSVSLFYAMEPWLKANAVWAALLNTRAMLIPREIRGKSPTHNLRLRAQMAFVTVFWG